MKTIADFSLRAEDFVPFCDGLRRPECVLADSDGTIFISDLPGGIMQISPDGSRTRLGNIAGVPNGIAMDADRNLIVTDIENGRLWKIARDRTQELILASVDGSPLGALNFVMVDSTNAIWASVSTRTSPRSLALADPRPDGYIIRLQDGVARVVADGIFFTNEIRLDPPGKFLYAAETCRGRILRFAVTDDGLLAPGETFGPAPLFDGARVDGIAFDASGNLWITEIGRNGIHVVSPEGEAHCVFEDADGVALQNPTSIAFSPLDPHMAYVGSLTMDRLMTFRSPVEGLRLSHW